MSDQFERSYFDAKFDGLKELMISQQGNLHDHIVAVSTNVKRLEIDMNAHKSTCPAVVSTFQLGRDLKTHSESTDAHGRKAADGALSMIVAWLALAATVIIGLFEAKRHP